MICRADTSLKCSLKLHTIDLALDNWKIGILSYVSNFDFLMRISSMCFLYSGMISMETKCNSTTTQDIRRKKIDYWVCTCINL